MKASDFDRKFDEGGNVTADLDLSKVRRPLSRTAARQRRLSVVDDPGPRPRGQASWGHSAIHYQGLDRREARAEGLMRR